jgi:hypothetical protein
LKYNTNLKTKNSKNEKLHKRNNTTLISNKDSNKFQKENNFKESNILFYEINNSMINIKQDVNDVVLIRRSFGQNDLAVINEIKENFGYNSNTENNSSELCEYSDNMFEDVIIKQPRIHTNKIHTMRNQDDTPNKTIVQNESIMTEENNFKQTNLKQFNLAKTNLYER